MDAIFYNIPDNLVPRLIMGYSTFSVYQWAIGSIVSQGGEALPICQGLERKAWKHEYALGLRSKMNSRSY